MAPLWRFFGYFLIAQKVTFTPVPLGMNLKIGEEKTMDILKELYCGNYDPHANFPYTEEYRIALASSRTYWDKVSKAFSREFADELWNAQAEVTVLECQYYYRKGFQLALTGMDNA